MKLYLFLLIGMVILLGSINAVSGELINDSINGYHLNNSLVSINLVGNNSLWNDTTGQILTTTYFNTTMFENSFSVCMRLNTSTTSGNAWAFQATNSGGTIGFIMYRNSAALRCYSLNATNSTINSYTAAVNTNYDMCCVYDLTTGNQTQYINGVFNNTLKLTGIKGAVNYTDNSIKIGNNAVGGTNGWNGTISDIRIFTKALNATEVTNTYNNINDNASLNARYQFKSGISSCTNLLQDYTIDFNYSFCNKTYYYVDSNTNGNLPIRTSVNNLDLNFNGATIDGDYRVNSLGIKIYSGNNNNITIRNLVIKDYWRGIDIQNISNLNLINITINNTNSSSIYCGACRNTTIDNAQLSYNTKDHLIYLDALYAGLAYNITVKNSKLLYANDNHYQDNSGNVDRINGIYFYNNEVAYNLSSSSVGGLNSIGSKNALFYNNSIHDLRRIADISYNQAGVGYNYGAYNNSYYNNTIYNIGVNTYDGGWSISNYTLFNNFYNNTYFNNSVFFWCVPTNTNFNIREYTPYVNIYLNGGNITYNYTGVKEATLNNMTLNITNQLSQYPYNDVYNISNGVVLSYDINNYNLTLTSSQKIIVSDYVCDKHYRDSSISYTCNTTACYFTNTNCTIKIGRVS